MPNGTSSVINNEELTKTPNQVSPEIDLLKENSLNQVSPEIDLLKENSPHAKGFQSRYDGRRLLELLDIMCMFYTMPFYYCLNYGVGCYYMTSWEKQYKSKLFGYIILGPILLASAFLCLPLAIVGYVIWCLLCHFASTANLAVYNARSPIKGHVDAEYKANRCVTVVTMNILGGCELISKFNNLPNVLQRMDNIAAAILHQRPTVLTNANKGLAHLHINDAVLSRFPHLDYICFQEMFDRLHAIKMISKLRHIYPYYVLDVGHHSMTTNLCLMGSGLMVASRCPILKSVFVPFTAKRGFQKAISYGILICKISLDCDAGLVGILGNLHNVAYEGKQPLIYSALGQVVDAVQAFKDQHVHTDESIEWEVIAGDYNSDNMSPSDLACAGHVIYQKYKDPAMKSAGLDADWSVGTELRQYTLHEEAMRTPTIFREILLDNVLRRHYILDADVEEQSFELMTTTPRTDNKGVVTAKPWGGKRRVDKVIFDPKLSVVKGTAVVSAIAGMTDHLPVVLAIERR